MREQLVEILPHLNRYSLFLTRHQVEAEDLMSETIVRALEKEQLFNSTTDLRSWMFTMMRNIFLDSRRHARVKEGYRQKELLRGAVMPPPQEEYVFLKEVLGLGLPYLQIVLDYAMGHPVYKHGYSETTPGTIKSRVSRCRRRLKELTGDGQAATRSYFAD